MIRRCPSCGCDDPHSTGAHAIAAALASDDLDLAMTLGLLDQPLCSHCGPACTTRLRNARDTRLAALAARERYRARQARLQRRTEALQTKRSAAAPDTAAKTTALPTAAAAALARAKARAAGRKTE